MSEKGLHLSFVKNVLTLSSHQSPERHNPPQIRILHVHDQAGVSGTLAKYQRKLGHISEVIVRDGYDAYGIQSFYADKVVTPKVPKFTQLSFVGKILRYSFRTLTVLMFYLYIFFHSRHFDIVHIHSCWIASFFTLKPKVIEFHGDDIRKFPSRKWKIDRIATDWFIKHYKSKIKFLVSTPDLLKDLPEAEYLPNPVDIEHFIKFPRFSLRIPIKNSVLTFWNWHEKQNLNRQLPFKCRVIMIDRTNKEHVPYRILPSVMSNFEYFLDRSGINSLSKTALEALSTGLTVIDWKGDILIDLPEQHNPFDVAENTIKIYKGVIADG